MLLKRIKLKNIRSYEEQEVEFPLGSTLLSGDIGSGKTSILLGIEFALFGLQPGQKGSSLLRNGAKEGSVEIEFETEGKQVVILRTLKRGKTITQDYCSITIDNDTKEISVTELKNQVLDLLKYPLEFSKKQNLLYKFTIYTPQEEMKEIILENPEIRINTLRHVFGIDKYKRILENIAIVSLKIREEKRRKEGMIENLENDKFSLISKEKELEDKVLNLSSLEKELFIKTELRKKVQEEKEEIVKKIEEKKKFQQEVEKTNLVLKNKEDSIFVNLKLTNELKRQIQEMEAIVFNELDIKKFETEKILLKKEKELFNEENLKLSSEINSLKLKNEDNAVLWEKISKIDICPTCLQDVNAVYKTNVSNKLEHDTVENNKKLKELEEKKSEVIKKSKFIDVKITETENKISELQILKVKLQGITEKKKRVEELERNNELLVKDIELLKKHLELIKISIFELNKFDNLLEIKQKELDNAFKEERFAEIKLAELKKEIDVFSKNLDEMREKIRKTEEAKSHLNYLLALEAWIEQVFNPLIATIEKNVMIKLKKEFSEFFSQWFSMLVSESFNVRLDDVFTPIIEQGDYELDYAYLSGGERTAVALAYRLALNQVINSLLSKIKTKDMLILDEPTDGFSEQQLDKMRDVLQQLNVRQLILVSHEQKIESFVENVIRFKKENNISQVGN